MVKEAVQALGSPTTNVAVRDWILSRYPGTNTNTIQCQTIVCTVNHASRIHYPENKKPRPATGQYDFLFRPDRGKLEWYDPVRHGPWQIAETDAGLLKVVPGSSPIDDAAADDACEDRGFAAEAHLRDYLALHLADIEPGLQLYTEDDGTDGIEYITDVGRIDILAVDTQGRFVVIELKVGQTPDTVCGQLMRYMGWVKRHLALGKDVRGIIIGQTIPDRIRYATADLPNAQLREYELSLQLRHVPHLDNGMRVTPPLHTSVDPNTTLQCQSEPPVNDQHASNRPKATSWQWLDPALTPPTDDPLAEARWLLDGMHLFANAELTFSCPRKDAFARGRYDPTSRRLLVLKGSTVAKEVVTAMPNEYRKLRQDLIDDGTIAIRDDGQLVFTRHKIFTSPSTAACIIEGGSRSGPERWKYADGRPLKEADDR